MRILFVVENYHPHVGGVEVLFRNLAEGLARKKHTVTVLTHRLHGTKQEEMLNGVRIVRVGSNRHAFSLAAILPAIRLARQADVIHTTTFNGAFPAWIAAKVTGKKAIITVHEVWIGLWKQLGDMSAAGKLFFEFAERMLYVLPFDRYVAVSESTKRQLLRIGINGKNVTRIYNAVDYAHFDSKQYDGKAVRRTLKLGKKFVYLAYGRPGASKGMAYVVEAAKEVHRKLPESMLILMLSTDKAYLKQYRTLARRVEKLHVNAKLLPTMPWKDVPKYVKAADCVVVPSLAEGFGYTAAEACALGVPVVASNTTSLPEVVSGKFLLVPPGNSKAMAQAIVAVSRKHYQTSPLKRFTLKDNLEGYLELYRKLSGKNGRRHK